jgi:hypothetical protein
MGLSSALNILGHSVVTTEEQAMRRTLRDSTIAGACALALAGGGLGLAASGPTTRLPVGSEPATLDPADFTTAIDNPYFPLRPGSRAIYRSTAPDGTRQRIVLTVTGDTRRIANGVTARVVHDRVVEGGRVVEDTRDWYAQDRAGNVWYLGEDTVECEDGRQTSTAGSFEAGVDGAQAGVIMPAAPRVGLTYRQEYFAGQAEDRAEVLRRDEQAEVPLRRFQRVLVTRDTTPLEPHVVEYKFYAPGVGPVLTVDISGSPSRDELVGLTRRAAFSAPEARCR